MRIGVMNNGGIVIDHSDELTHTDKIVIIVCCVGGVVAIAIIVTVLVVYC